MTPKEKAQELVGKFYINIPLRDCDNRRPHKYALISVDEILRFILESESINIYWIEYWNKVKQEIEKI